jgi:hypothetical protein
MGNAVGADVARLRLGASGLSATVLADGALTFIPGLPAA